MVLCSNSFRRNLACLSIRAVTDCGRGLGFNAPKLHAPAGGGSHFRDFSLHKTSCLHHIRLVRPLRMQAIFVLDKIEEPTSISPVFNISSELGKLDIKI